MALHYGGEAHEKEFRKIHEGEEGGRKGRGGKMAVGRDEERERETRLVLICHRSPSPIRCPFRILDQRESYANLPRSTSRLS